MAKDYYAEEIAPTRDYFSEEIEKKPAITDFLKGIFQPYTQPTNVFDPLASYKSWRKLGENVAEVGVPTMQKVPILKDIPFGARYTGDPNAIMDLMLALSPAGRTTIATSAKSTLPQTVKNVTNPTGLAQRFRNTMFGIKRQASEKFGEQLDDLVKINPNKTISLSSIIENLKTEAIDNPKLRSLINRIPDLKQAISNPEVNVKEAQNIINGIRGTLPQIKLRGFNVRPQDISIFDLVDDIRTAQMDAFPEMANIRSEYGNILNKYNLVKNQLKVGATEKALAKKFGSKEVWGEMKQILPPAIRKEISKYATGTSVGKVIKRFLPWIVGGEVLRRGSGGMGD